MKSNEWYTPAKYIEAAREVMGGIDLDPASCALANETVRATKYYTQEDDGLTKEWYGNVWLNPPFSHLSAFVKYALRMYEAGSIPQVCIFVMMSSYAAWFFSVVAYPFCIMHEKVVFLTPNGERRTHRYHTCCIYLGPHTDRFTRVFSQFGTIARRVEVPV